MKKSRFAHFVHHISDLKCLFCEDGRISEREPSIARLPEILEYDFSLQTDDRNYNIDAIFYNRLMNDEREVNEANLPRVCNK